MLNFVILSYLLLLLTNSFCLKCSNSLLLVLMLIYFISDPDFVDCFEKKVLGLSA